jgi:hypothetical protein
VLIPWADLVAAQAAEGGGAMVENVIKTAGPNLPVDAYPKDPGSLAELFRFVEI